MRVGCAAPPATHAFLAIRPFPKGRLKALIRFSDGLFFAHTVFAKPQTACVAAQHALPARQRPSETFVSGFRRPFSSAAALQENRFAAAAAAFAAQPVDEGGHDFGEVAALAFGFAGVGFFPLRGVDRAGNQDVGAQVGEAAPFVGDAEGEVVEGSFRCAEAAPVGLRRFAVAFADEDDGGVFRLHQQGGEGTGESHGGDGVDAVLFDPVGDGLEVERGECGKIAGAVDDAVEPAARGFGDGGGQLGEFVFFGGEQVEADGVGFGRAGGDDFVVNLFHAFLPPCDEDDGGAFSGAVFGGGGAYALRGAGNQDGFSVEFACHGCYDELEKA